MQIPEHLQRELSIDTSGLPCLNLAQLTLAGYHSALAARWQGRNRDYLRLYYTGLDDEPQLAQIEDGIILDDSSSHTPCALAPAGRGTEAFERMIQICARYLEPRKQTHGILGTIEATGVLWSRIQLNGSPEHPGVSVSPISGTVLNHILYQQLDAVPAGSQITCITAGMTLFAIGGGWLDAFETSRTRGVVKLFGPWAIRPSLDSPDDELALSIEGPHGETVERTYQSLDAHVDHAAYQALRDAGLGMEQARCASLLLEA